MLLALAVALAGAAAPEPVRDVPEPVRRRLSLSPRHVKWLDAEGFAVVGSAQVADAALREAKQVVTAMLSARPGALKRLGATTAVRLVVMAPSELTTDVPEHADLTPKDFWDRRARGLGATVARPAISCAEENLLGEPGDPYATESICVHEFAHVIADFVAPTQVKGFAAKLEAIYERAKAKGTWRGTYAMQNPGEYWAEGVQSWFDTNRHDDPEHGRIDTRAEVQAEDPALAALITEVLGEVSWRYVKPDRRSAVDRATLGPWPDPVPTFHWPERLPPLTEIRR